MAIRSHVLSKIREVFENVTITDEEKSFLKKNDKIWFHEQLNNIKNTALIIAFGIHDNKDSFL